MVPRFLVALFLLVDYRWGWLLVVCRAGCLWFYCGACLVLLGGFAWVIVVGGFGECVVFACDGFCGDCGAFAFGYAVALIWLALLCLFGCRFVCYCVYVVLRIWTVAGTSVNSVVHWYS